jgi:rubrerythrin
VSEGPTEHERPVYVTEGGDPACWVGQVCPECGRFSEQANPVTCPNCGAAFPDD